MPATSTDYRSLWSVLQGLSSTISTTLVGLTSQPSLYASLLSLTNESMGISAPGSGATDAEVAKYNRKTGPQLLEQLALVATFFDDICDRCQDAAVAAAGLLPRWSAIPETGVVAGVATTIDLAPHLSSSLPVTLTARAAWAEESAMDLPALSISGQVLSVTPDGATAEGATAIITLTAASDGGTSTTTFRATVADTPSISSSIPEQIVRAGVATEIDLSAYVDAYLLPVTLSVTGLLAGDTAKADGTKLVLTMQGEAVRQLGVTVTTAAGTDSTTMTVKSANPPTVTAVPDQEATTGTAKAVSLSPYIGGILPATLTAYGSNPDDTVSVSGKVVTVTPASEGVRTVFFNVRNAIGTTTGSFKVTAAAAQS